MGFLAHTVDQAINDQADLMNPREVEEIVKAEGLAGGGDMKRCPSCNWRNKIGSTACKKCGAKLRKTGDEKAPDKVEKAEEFTKPGTANVSPADRVKLRGLIEHYRKSPHPFTACKRDQMKHGLSEDHANRRCAVLKDLMEGTTHWRGRGK